MNVIVLLGYNCQDTLEDVVNAIPQDVVAEIIYIGDFSKDNSISVAKSLKINQIILHDHNIGYGGNQKSLYTKALGIGADIIIMLHLDDQYDPKLIPEIIAQFSKGADVVLASRMMHKKEALYIGMPSYKYYANRFLTYNTKLLI